MTIEVQAEEQVLTRNMPYVQFMEILARLHGSNQLNAKEQLAVATQRSHYYVPGYVIVTRLIAKSQTLARDPCMENPQGTYLLQLPFVLEQRVYRANASGPMTEVDLSMCNNHEVFDSLRRVNYGFLRWVDGKENQF